MKPIAILRHVSVEGPGYLAEFLDARHIPWHIICIDEGESVPRDARNYSGLVFMGGSMSVNDDYPWIGQELDLIRDAVAKDIPVLGHCFGGQLISKALGGIVASNPTKEVGWARVTVPDSDVARAWFAEVSCFEAFHWHGETFTLPEGATLILSSEHCVNQAYAVGKHLALQCHVEMTIDMVEAWCEVNAEEITRSPHSHAVQSAAEMRRLAIEYIPQLQNVATHIYTQWLRGTLD